LLRYFSTKIKNDRKNGRHIQESWFGILRISEGKMEVSKILEVFSDYI